jgi:hypothetical protein
MICDMDLEGYASGFFVGNTPKFACRLKKATKNLRLGDI